MDKETAAKAARDLKRLKRKERPFSQHGLIGKLQKRKSDARTPEGQKEDEPGAEEGTEEPNSNGIP